MKNTARLISWILMIMMVVSLIPVSISAADECDHAEYGIVSVLKEANCAEGIRGIGKFECVSCGHTWYAQYDGHNMVETTIDATCDSPALVGEQCTICGAVGEATEVEGSTPRDHGWRTLYDHEDTVDATCEEGGVRVRECRYCGEIKLEEREPYGHWWRSTNDKVVDADCENPSGIKQTCSDCGKSQIVPVEGVPSEPAKGHTYEAVEDVAPTCKEPGLTGKKVCSVCGKVDKDNPGTEVPADASAHKAELVSTLKAATCTVNGIGKYACEYCGANIGYKVIPASHNFELLVGAGVDATCGEDGEAVYFCTGCGEEEIKVIEATGEHDMVETTIDADCNNPAMVGEQCTVCGAVGEATVVEDSEALGHDMVVDEENEDYVPATCTEGGLDTLKCSRCDYAETKETEALGHEWIDLGVVEADCENAAGVEQFCVKCEEIQVVPFEGELAEEAKGHTPEAVEDKAPTCKTPGVTGQTKCSVCGEVVDEGTEVPVDANAHKAVLVDVLKPATCTVNGIGKYACEYCDANMGYKAFLADHEWGEEEFDEETLVIYCGCLNCDEIYIVEDLNEHVHAYEAVITEPTCTTAGYTTYTCECGDTYTADEVAAIEHTYEAVVTEPTCTTAGYTTYTCVCGDTYTADEVAVGEHTWDEGVITKKPTETTTGIRTYTCGICGVTKTENIAKLSHSHNYKAVMTGGSKISYVCSCGDTLR